MLRKHRSQKNKLIAHKLKYIYFLRWLTKAPPKHLSFMIIDVTNKIGKQIKI